MTTLDATRRPSRRTWIVMSAVVLVATVIGASAAWLPFGEEATPAGGLDAFLSAMKDQDTRRARELLCDRLKPEFDRTGTFRIGTLGYHPSLTWTIWSEEDAGDHSPVTLMVNMEFFYEHPAYAWVSLVREGAGSWRVCGSEDIFTKAL